MAVSPTRIVPLVVATALFMENMDQTILATALPTIARDLKLDPIALKLAITSYLLGLAVFVPVSGWIADRLGARTTFRTALLVFMAASIGCAFARSLETFAAWRLVQGIGGAMMVPVGRIVILRTVPKADLVRALATLTIPSLIGPMLGPPLGGFIVTIADWRWIFFVNIPIGVLGIVLATVFFSDAREPPRPLDVKGFLLAAPALAGLVLGMAMAGKHIAPPEVAIGAVAGGLVLGALYVRHALSTPEPLLDLRLFRLPTFSAGVLGGLLFRIGIGAIAFLLPLMLQLGLDIDPFHSGLVLLAGGAGAILMKPIAPAILARFGFRAVLAVNCVIAAVALALNAAITAAWPLLAIAALVFANGITRSLQFSSMNAISYAEIDHSRTSVASGLASVVQQVSVGLGVAIGAMVLETSQRLRGHAAPMTVDFSTAILVVAAITALAAIKMARLPADAGNELAGRPARKESEPEPSEIA